MSVKRAGIVPVRSRARRRPFGPRQGISKDQGSGRRAPVVKFIWSNALSEEEWVIYSKAIDAARSSGARFMLGGGFALATFTGRWRDTKDIDFYIHPRDRAAAIAAVTRAGFRDYFSRRPYDRKWIYRSVRGDVIVDLIWSMANQRA